VIYELRTCGHCMGPDYENLIVTIDTSAALASGDLVAADCRDKHTGEGGTIIKWLEMTADGRWWLQCLESVMPLGGYFMPLSLAKVVARRPADPNSGTSWSPFRADRRLIEFYDKCSVDARVEWTERGKTRGTPFPGLDAALQVDLALRYPDLHGSAA
jgi:hypothetical protein